MPDYTRDLERRDTAMLHMLAEYMADRTLDGSWLRADPGPLEAYMPDDWQDASVCYLAEHLDALDVDSACCIFA